LEKTVVAGLGNGEALISIRLATVDMTSMYARAIKIAAMQKEVAKSSD
jgi:hypothetical protein